jgi:heat shock protein HslJ
VRRAPLPALVALGIAACAAPPGPEPVAPKAIVGSRWVGVVGGNPDPNSLPRVEFVTETRLTGFTGCNAMNGTWKLEGGVVRLGPIATTKRACAGPGDLIERRVTAAMTDGRIFREGANLVFIGATNERFVFAPAGN